MKNNNTNDDLYTIIIAFSCLVFVCIISGYLKKIINYIFCRNEECLTNENRV